MHYSVARGFHVHQNNQWLNGVFLDPQKFRLCLPELVNGRATEIVLK